MLQHSEPRFSVKCGRGLEATKIFNIQIFKHIGRLARMSVLDTEVDGSNPGSSMLFPRARHFIHIASVDSAVE